MHISGEGAVIPFGTDRLVEQCIDCEWVRLPRFVGHLCSGLVHVDECTIGSREAHGHTRTGEESGTVGNPLRGPVIVIRVQPDPVVELGLWHTRVIAPDHTVFPMGNRRRQAWIYQAECVELICEKGFERRWSPVGTTGVEMQPYLEASAVIGSCLGISQYLLGIDVSTAPDALPVFHRTPRRAARHILIELRSNTIPSIVIIICHDHHGLRIPGEVPEARQGFPVEVHLNNQVRQQSLLFIGLRDGHFVEVDPVGLRISLEHPRRRGRPI